MSSTIFFANILMCILLMEYSNSLEGPNVCTFQEPYNTTVITSEKKPYHVKEYVWCQNIPPRCTKYRIDFKTEFKIETVEKNRAVRRCCEGYAQSSDEKSCYPICSHACAHGYCGKPNVCTCESGYEGITCDKKIVI